MKKTSHKYLGLRPSC